MERAARPSFCFSFLMLRLLRLLSLLPTRSLYSGRDPLLENLDLRNSVLS
jgi:hypothetical protein